MTLDEALAKAKTWTENPGIDGEVWSVVRMLAAEYDRLRPFERATVTMARHEREFAAKMESVTKELIAGVELRAAQLSDARQMVERLTAGLRRIAKDYDVIEAGKIALATLGET